MITDRFQWFGASVRGPRHLRMKEPNQDAWLGKSYKNYAIITVCDGLGSRSNSKKGAQTACRAVRQAFKTWVKCSDVTVQHLLRLIKLLWEMEISPSTSRDCATTCLFACMTDDNRLIIGGLGDGIAIVKRYDGTVMKVIERGEAFLNHTIALGDPHKLEDWKYLDILESHPGDIILLATDGIADDLIEERIPDLTEWLIKEYGSMPPKDRSQALRKAIHNWPTPSHQDDKTIAILYRVDGGDKQ